MSTFEMRTTIPDVWIGDRLSEWGITFLTDIQQKAVAAGILQGKSLIASGPTSSGKTLIAELAALAATRSGERVLYLVSHRALADQKYADFNERFANALNGPLTSVAISTGDRSEGNADAQIRIATYEKAIGLIMSGQVIPENTLVIADELQIICDPARGAAIETLCAIFRQKHVKQFVALTATVQNPQDLADWMGCSLVESSIRGTPLNQQIWYGAKIYSTVFGETSAIEAQGLISNGELSGVISHLIDAKLGPILVFSETKKEAAAWAADFIRRRPRTVLGIALSDQLELFSEPTDASEKLQQSAERGVAFHTADLSAQERQVLEDGFKKSQFDVCFATSTLAAGVNFPFRTIVFPKLSFQYREPPRDKLSVSDYRNMSGRAGRLGLHIDGYAILLPKGPLEFSRAQELVQPRNEVIESVMLKLSLRRTLLSLVASNIANTVEQIDLFFENTLYWHQVLRSNANSQAVLQRRSRDAVAWLTANGLATDAEGELKPTQLGRATAISGLLPETAVNFYGMLDANRTLLEQNFDDVSDGTIYACCASGEFRAKPPSRFLPFGAANSFGGFDFWRSKKLLGQFDTSDQQLLQCAQAVALYITGLAERKIAYATGLSAGSIQSLASDVSWVLDGLQRISIIPDLHLSQRVSNQISQLARRVRWGVPAETLDLLRVAEKHRVPGVGRQRAMELVQKGYFTLQDLIGAGKEKLLDVLKSAVRVDALLDSASANSGHATISFRDAHVRIGHGLGIGDIVERCYTSVGVPYEQAILELLQYCDHLQSKSVDTGTRPNVPDLLLKSGDLEAFVECKTASKSHGLISKEDAWAVVQKAADMEATPQRVTLGKPAFDESSKKKAAAASDITLVENEVFLEAVMRLLLKEIDSKIFMTWLGEPGVAEIDRLPGRYSYSLR